MYTKYSITLKCVCDCKIIYKYKACDSTNIEDNAQGDATTIMLHCADDWYLTSLMLSWLN